METNKQKKSDDWASKAEPSILKRAGDRAQRSTENIKMVFEVGLGTFNSEGNKVSMEKCRQGREVQDIR